MNESTRGAVETDTPDSDSTTIRTGDTDGRSRLEGVTISGVEVIQIALPGRRAFRWRGLTHDLGQWTLVRVHTSSGHAGYGEACALGHWGGDNGRYYGETSGTVRHIVEDRLAPVVSGQRVSDIELMLKLMDDSVRGHPYAKAAVEMAIYDVLGKIIDLPVYELLGGRVRDGVPIAHMLGLMSVEDAVTEAKIAVEEGIGAFQVKSAGHLAHDEALLRALRAAVGPEVALRLDANQGYRGLDVKTVVRAVNALQAAGADMVEQPTEGLRQMAGVRAAVTLPIVADESCWAPQDVVDVHALAATDVISIYVAKAGGLTRAKRVAALAEAFGYPCDVNGSLESGIGNAANVHFAVSTPRVTLPCVIPVSNPAGASIVKVAGKYYEDDVIASGSRFEAGRLYPSDRPGLVEVDTEKIERYRIN